MKKPTYSGYQRGEIMNDEKLVANLMWTLVALVVFIVAMMPELLLVPIIGLIAFMAYKVWKKQASLEPGDLMYQAGAFLILLLAYIWPTLIFITFGFALAKAIDYR